MTTERDHPDLLRLDSLRAGEGTDADRRHVGTCDLCRAELEIMEKNVLAIEAAMPAPPDLPEGARQEILEAVRHGSSPRRLQLWRPMYALPLAAAALLAFMVLLPGGEKGDIEGEREAGVSAVPAGRPTLDVNGDGFLDSGDVDELARIIDGGAGPADGWDFNGDGRTDGGDIDFLSREIGTDSDVGIRAGC